MRDYERKAIADAAYDAWRNGGDYDYAWNRAEQVIDSYGPYSYYEAQDVLAAAQLTPPRPEPEYYPEHEFDGQ